MAGLSRLGGASLLSVESSGVGRIEAIAAHTDGRTTLWVANLTAEPQSLQLPDLGRGARIALLSADEFERAAKEPDFMAQAARDTSDGVISLDAYAVARVEFSER